MKHLTTLIVFVFVCLLNTQIHAPEIAKSSAGGAHEGKQYKSGNNLTYRWTYSYGYSSVDLELSLVANYGYEHMQSVYHGRSHQHGDYPQRVYTDPFSRDYLVVAQMLYNLAAENRLDPVRVCLSFVQSLPYDAEIGNYQRDAIETLIDRKGDCSDKSVLLAALLGRLGCGVIFIKMPNHLAVGVNYYNNWYPGTSVNHFGKEYYFCETTSNGDVGETTQTGSVETISVY